MRLYLRPSYLIGFQWQLKANCKGEGCLQRAAFKGNAACRGYTILQATCKLQYIRRLNSISTAGHALLSFWAICCLVEIFIFSICCHVCLISFFVDKYRKSPNKRRVSVSRRVSNRRRVSRSIVRINAGSQLNAGSPINVRGPAGLTVCTRIWKACHVNSLAIKDRIR